VSVTVLVREGLLADGDPPRLLASRCRACRALEFPRRDACPYCASDDVEAVELSTLARLWAWTAVTTRPPGYRGEVPYGFGVVELPEGLRIVTRLTESDPALLHLGQPMRLVVSTLHVDDECRTVGSYAFEPADEP
jgi:uncharacterized OB-fold protein